jgi:uncharacterized protein YqeY
MATMEEQLNDRLKEAMRSKDAKAADVLRMLKTKVMERRTAKGFTGQVDDALVLEVITAYVKQLKKAVDEYAALGERGAEMVTQLSYEVGYCEQFLPKMIGEPETEALVKEAIGKLGATDVKQAGKVMGEVLKTHKGKVDPALVKKLAERLLATSTP